MDYHHNIFQAIQHAAVKTNIISEALDVRKEKAHPAGNAITHHEPFEDSYILKTNSPITLFLISYAQKEIEQGYINHSSAAYDRFPTGYYDFNTPHVHESIEFFYVLSGYIDFQINHEFRRFSQGMAGIINQNVKHLEHYSVDSVTIYITLTNDYIRKLYEGYPIHAQKPLQKFLLKNRNKSASIEYIDFIPIHDSDYSELRDSILYLIDEMLQKKEGYQFICKGIMQRIFYYLQSGSLFTCSETSLELLYSNKICKTIVDYVQKRRYHITRKELAAALNYNEDYLNYIFYNETKQNLGTYIRNVYLEEASRLLLSTDLSINGIIERLHLANRTSFYNQFQKKYGTTPAQYRESRRL